MIKMFPITNWWMLVMPFLMIGACQNKNDDTFISHPKEVKRFDNIELEVHDFSSFEPFLHRVDDKVHVVNFWATWCAPCVKELPAFEKLKATDDEVDVLLVSLDFPDAIEKGLIPFIKKNNIQSKVILLDDSDENTWIPKVNKNWQGAIPVTIIYNKTKSMFYERSFTFEELEEEINKFK